MNAALGHGADFDDGHRTALGHPGVTVIPVGLALGEAEGLRGKDNILSIIVGYQVFVKITSAINPSHFSKGFHTTGTVSTLAAAATAAKILGLKVNDIQNALSLGCLQSAGLLEVTGSGQMVKPFHPAKAAYNGIIASLIVKEGIVAPSEIFDGNKGFLLAMAGSLDFELDALKLGSEYEITNCYFRLYPTCRHIHSAVDAALEVKKTTSWMYDDIRKIRVTTYPAGIRLTGNIFFPHSADEAKFSLPYAVAKALYKGRFTLDEICESASLDERIKKLIEKVEIISDPAFEDRDVNIRGAQVNCICQMAE